jgi:hypothetical protein
MDRKPFASKFIGRGQGRRFPVGLCTGALALALLVVPLVSLAQAAVAGFPDVPDSHAYFTAITDLASRGIITGYDDGRFRPGDPVKRQQFAKMAVLAGQYPVSEGDVCQFTDVERSDAGTLYPDNYIAVCAAKGITTGKSPGRFDPQGYITRCQVVSMVVRMAKNLKPDMLTDPPAGWSATGGWDADQTHGANAAVAEYNGLLGGLDLATLQPSANMSRGEVAQVLHNLLQKLGTSGSTSTSTTAAHETMLRFVKSVAVTPVGKFAGGLFSRVGYVPGKDRIVVAFKAKLNQPESDSLYAYGYREYSTNMEATGQFGIITSQNGPDVGGLFTGNDFYMACMGHDNTSNEDGWWLSKWDAVTWTSSVPSFFYPVGSGEGIGDPMIAVVNGLIDISGKYKTAADIGPGHATHHQFFSPDLKFVAERVLSEASHIDLTSLVVADGVINLVTSTDLWGDMIVMQYDTNWHYLGEKTLKLHASAPEGAVFDGSRFYVSYVDNSLSGTENLGLRDNVRLAAFDSNWNLLDDVAVTSFSAADRRAPGRPSLALHAGRIYVCYDEAKDVTAGQTPEESDLQVHVAVYDLINP